jgi:hypothetical protein
MRAFISPSPCSLDPSHRTDVLIFSSDNVDGRALDTGMAVPGGANSMSVAACTAACDAGGYMYAGVEYAAECCELALSSPTPFALI